MGHRKETIMHGTGSYACRTGDEVRGNTDREPKDT